MVCFSAKKQRNKHKIITYKITDLNNNISYETQSSQSTYILSDNNLENLYGLLSSIDSTQNSEFENTQMWQLNLDDNCTGTSTYGYTCPGTSTTQPNGLVSFTASTAVLFPCMQDHSLYEVKIYLEPSKPILTRKNNSCGHHLGRSIANEQEKEIHTILEEILNF